MPVPTIALYASPPSSVCSAPHPCQINAHASYDFELSTRSSSSASSSPSTTHKPVIGGLSCLFSSPSVRSSSSFSGGGCGEELSSKWHDRGDELKELSNSYCYMPIKFAGSYLKKDLSPVSVFQGPVSCGSSVVGSARSPPTSFQSGLFNGFVRNALGSCVDYDSPHFEVRSDEFNLGLAEELTFNIEMEGNSEPYVKELLLGAQLRHKIFREDFVVKAFYEAEKAHRGQIRASGDPYLQHCVETAVLLALIGANSTVVAAGLLHDTLDDSFMSYDYICGMFGAGVADLVRGVSKLSHLSKLARDNNTASKTVEADRLHTMFLAMADARAVLIKLADRLHNMMTLDALPPAKQQRFAKETLEIFAPLANRLGIFTWKEQLENMCFKHLNPDQHKELSSKLVDSFDEAMITAAIEKLERALEVKAISYHDVCGRHKSLYSIYRKMLKKKLTMDEIHDIHGLRLIVDNEEDCYKALRVVHQLWSAVPGKLKDYISRPKFNGYQSLHTVVMGEGMVPLEVQIRTREMDLQAEFGFAPKPSGLFYFTAPSTIPLYPKTLKPPTRRTHKPFSATPRALLQYNRKPQLSGETPRVVVITSGKGGVGKTTTTANVGLSLARLGFSVVAIDADVGLRNLDLLLGLENRVNYTVVEVLNGDCRLDQALVRDKRWSNFELLCISKPRSKLPIGFGGKALVWVVDALKARQEGSPDFILIDCPAGIDAGFITAITPANEAVLVTTPDITSLRDADRVTGLLECDGIRDIKMIVNRVRTDMIKGEDMMSVLDVQEMLGLALLGVIPEDSEVIRSTNRGYPLVLNKPPTLAGLAFEQAAWRLVEQDSMKAVMVEEEPKKRGFFSFFGR